jgi:hypothetical protein
VYAVVDAITLERAREIAQAELDLARVPWAKVALIERTRAFAATAFPRRPNGPFEIDSDPFSR